MTIREIAKRAQVSSATVSRYLNGAHTISADKAARIGAVMSALRDGEAPKTRAVISQLVGVLVPDFKLQFYIDAMREITRQLPDYNFQVVFIAQSADARQSHLDMIKALKLSGLILLSEESTPGLLRLIEQKRLRVVICGGANLRFGGQATAVHINDLAGGYEGTKYLIGLGHRDIAFLGDMPHSISGGFQRIAGARQALKEAALPFDEQLWRCGDMTDDTGYELTRQLIREKHKFTALFAFSDQMAVGAMRAFADEGIGVPRDVSVMGFDDLPIAERTRPRLTTIHQPLDEIVAATLTFFAQPHRAMHNTEINVPFSVVERDSCRVLTGGQP